MDMQLTGKRVLITGASQGIGAGIAHAFAKEGCNLVLVARSGEKLARVQQELASRYQVDIAIEAMNMSLDESALALVEKFASIDILINNAGSIPVGNLWDIDAARWREAWNLKVMGYINLTRAYYQRMRERRSGVILNNIGIGGENYDFDYIAGTTGNAALMAFTRALGGRSLQDGIRVVGVNPGLVETERLVSLMHRRAASSGDRSDEEYASLLNQLPLQRAATVQEVADLFVFLASPRSAYTSGVIVTLDGGTSSNKAIH